MAGVDRVTVVLAMVVLVLMVTPTFSSNPCAQAMERDRNIVIQLDQVYNFHAVGPAIQAIHQDVKSCRNTAAKYSRCEAMTKNVDDYLRFYNAKFFVNDQDDLKRRFGFLIKRTQNIAEFCA